jgi:ADP-heptose:LPS heptosyltransferase
MRMDKRRLLIMFPGALGDLICALPAIRTIADQHPGADLELMARAELARFAVSHLGAARGHSLDRRETGHLFEPSTDLSAARAFFSGFDHIYSFFATDNANFRARLKAAAGGPAAFMPFRPSGTGHVAVGYLREAGDAAASAGRAVALSRIAILPEDLAAGNARLDALGLRAGHFWLIFPGSGSLAKNWPAQYYADLADILGQKVPALVVLGPAEAGLKSLFDSRRITTLTDLELGTVAGLARLARGFVGNDSGVAHLAASAGAAGIVIFGPTDPMRWRPLGRVEVIRSDPLSAMLPATIASRGAALAY